VKLMRKRKEGFTLVELLIVMAVIAALMGALVPVALNAINHAKATRVAENMRTILAAAQQYAYSEHSIPSTNILAANNAVTGGDLNDYGISYKSGGNWVPLSGLTGSNASKTITSDATIAVYYTPDKPTAKQLGDVWSRISEVDKVDGNNTHPAATTTIAKYW
jgi:prepilin-type N-terminal cleavage/methylation domain-containing protein